MVPHSNFSLCTFNCRSIKSSVSEVRELCGKFDLVCVQEHWLLPNELDYLSSIHSIFWQLADLLFTFHEVHWLVDHMEVLVFFIKSLLLQ